MKRIGIKREIAMRTLFFISLIWIIGSVSAQSEESKITLDYYTTVDRLFYLEAGMSLDEVNSALLSEPHDVLQHTFEGYLMLEYKYLIKYRSIEEDRMYTDAWRLEGEEFYQEPKSVYLMFDNYHKLQSYVTADALSDLKEKYKMEATAVALGEITKAKQSNAMILRPGETIVSPTMNAPTVKAEKAKPKAMENKDEDSVSGIGASLRALRDEVQSKMTKEESTMSAWSSGDKGYFMQDTDQIPFEVLEVTSDPAGNSILRIQYIWSEETMVMDVRADDPGLIKI